MFSEGIFPINKPKNKTSFSLVAALRRKTGIKKIGHAGTLDPFATGVMVMLIGKTFTRQSAVLMSQDKEYLTTVHLGIETDSFDIDGKIVAQNDKIPSLTEIEEALAHFQGSMLQTPPMFSAKKVKGKKLYELARKGIEIERVSVQIQLKTELVSYEYPHLVLRIECSKGTYIRSIAHDLGALLQTGAHLSHLVRTRSGSFYLKDCFDGTLLYENST